MKRATFAVLRFDPDATAMSGDDLLADAETDTAARIIFPFVEPLEDIENLLLMLGPYSDAIILDRQLITTGRGLGRNVNDRRSLPAEFEGIAE